MALGNYEESSAFTELEKLVLRYSEAMTQTPVDVSDDLFNDLSRHLNSQQLVELTSAIAWENYRARFDHAFGIEPEGFSTGAVCGVLGVKHTADASDNGAALPQA